MQRVASLVVSLLALLVAAPAGAQDRPRSGGELVFVVPAEPPSYDAHREDTFALIHPTAPHYNTLLRTDPADRTGTRIIGDLAESWTVSRDGRTYTLELRRGVKFHDGTELTSKDVKATYDKIISPPAAVASIRKGEYIDVEAVQAPDASTIVFRLKWPSGSFLSSLASPWNWIYKADILARDMRWYEKNIMGTGPFTFVEHVKGSHWVGRKNPNYWDAGKPYLDGYRAIFIRDSAAQVAAIRGERAMIQFRGFSPAERDTLVQALGPRITVQESSSRRRSARPTTAATPTRCWTSCTGSRAGPPTRRSGRSTSASSSGACSTRRPTTSRRCSGTGSSPTTRACGAGR
jgi:peptide/nickel transport system substrate-binding protein